MNKHILLPSSSFQKQNQLLTAGIAERLQVHHPLRTAPFGLAPSLFMSDRRFFTLHMESRACDKQDWKQFLMDSVRLLAAFKGLEMHLHLCALAIGAV